MWLEQKEKIRKWEEKWRNRKLKVEKKNEIEEKARRPWNKK